MIGLGCKKDKKTEIVLEAKAKIVRDCVGTYIDIEGAGLYKVCNADKTSSIANGSTISIKYVKIDICTGGFLADNSCYLIIKPNNGTIDILSIN